MSYLLAASQASKGAGEPAGEAIFDPRQSVALKLAPVRSDDLLQNLSILCEARFETS